MTSWRNWGTERFSNHPLVGKGVVAQLLEKERQSRAANERDRCGVSRGSPCPPDTGKDRVIQDVIPLAPKYLDEGSSTGVTGVSRVHIRVETACEPEG